MNKISTAAEEYNKANPDDPIGTRLPSRPYLVEQIRKLKTKLALREAQLEEYLAEEWTSSASQEDTFARIDSIRKHLQTGELPEDYKLYTDRNKIQAFARDLVGKPRTLAIAGIEAALRSEWYRFALFTASKPASDEVIKEICPFQVSSIIKVDNSTRIIVKGDRK